MQLFIACFLLVLVSATVANHHKDWSDFAMPGCEDYTKAIMEKAEETGAKDDFKKCFEEKESKEEKKECFWNRVMDLAKSCDAEPSDDCKANAKIFFKME